MLHFYAFSDAEVPSKPCINGGSYNVTELSLKGQTDLCNKNGFNQVSIYCHDPVMIKFLRECSNKIQDSGKVELEIKRHLAGFLLFSPRDASNP